MRFIWIVSAIAVVGLVASASAQVDQSTRQQIERIATAYAENFEKQDAAGIARLYTRDGVLVNPSTKAVYHGLREIEQSHQALFKLGFNHDQATVDQVSLVGTDAAISVGEYHFTGQGHSGPIKADGHWTAVYVREGGTWKIRLLTAVAPNPPPASGSATAPPAVR